MTIFYDDNNIIIYYNIFFYFKTCYEATFTEWFMYGSSEHRRDDTKTSLKETSSNIPHFSTNQIDSRDRTKMTLKASVIAASLT